MPSEPPFAAVCPYFQVYKFGVHTSLLLPRVCPARVKTRSVYFYPLAITQNRPYTSSYQSVQRFVLKLRGAVSHEARVIIETQPGEEAQVDYGTGPMVRDLSSAGTGARG